MEMEVMIPPPPPPPQPLEYNGGSPSTTPYISASTTPYITAPSSPQSYANFFYSAPTSPTRISAFYGGDNSLSTPSAVPFDWEEKPGTPKSHRTTAGDTDFAFDFSGHLELASLPADELFDGGKIKPLKPPPRFHYDQIRPLESPKSPKSPRKFAQAFSPRHHKARNSEFDPFAAAIEHTQRENASADRRGRERNTNPPSSSSSSSRERTRSLSPFRVSDLLFDPEPNHEDQSKSTPSNNPSLFSNSPFSSSWYKKWKIKDLLLFRSASESRAKDKEQMKKYSQMKKPRPEDVKNSSFRSTESVGSVSSRRRSGPPISAHELHYTVNRAFSEEMRKRTSLPYKQGLLGCLGFNPTVSDISKGFNPSGCSSRG